MPWKQIIGFDLGNMPNAIPLAIWPRDLRHKRMRNLSYAGGYQSDLPASISPVTELFGDEAKEIKPKIQHRFPILPGKLPGSGHIWS